MPDTPEVVGGPPAVDQTGNLTIWWIPGENAVPNPEAIPLALLTGNTATRVTYSFLPDGWALTMPQTKDDDNRLTSPQRRQALGVVNPELADLRYVDSTDPKSLSVLAATGGPGCFVERRNVPQSEVVTASHKLRVIKVTLGVQAPGPTNGTGKFSHSQTAVVEHVSALHTPTAA